MLPTLTLGEAVDGTIDGVQDIRYYRLEMTEGAHLLVTLDKPNWWYGRIYMAMGHLPTSGDASSVDSRYDQVIEIDPSEGGTYYILVRSGWNPSYPYDCQYGSFVLSALAEEMLPTLRLGVSMAGVLEGTQDMKHYRLEVDEAEHLFVELDKNSSWRGRICIAYGELATSSDTCSIDVSSDQLLEIPSTDAGTYYIRIYPGWNPSYPYDCQYGSYKLIPTSLNTTVTVTDVSPERVGTGIVTVAAEGYGFQEGASVYLRDDEGTEIEAFAVRPVSSTRVEAVFDLTDVEVGATLDLLVTNPNQAETAFLDAVTVDEAQEALWVNVAGQDRIRIDTDNEFTITYGNNGTVDSFGAVLWIGGIPSDAAYNLDVEILSPPEIPVGEPVDYGEVPAHIETQDGILLPLLLPILPAGTSETLTLSLNVPTSQEFRIEAWLTEPIFSFEAIAAICEGRGMSDIECLAEIAKTAAGLALGALLPDDCIQLVISATQTLTQVIFDDIGGLAPSPISLGQSLIGMTIKGLKCAGVANPYVAAAPPPSGR